MRQQPLHLIFLCAILFSACSLQSDSPPAGQTLSAQTYYDKIHGAWQATMFANHTGLLYEGQFLEAPGPGDEIELALLDEWSTDDDTHVEWVDLHILETYGVNPTYEQIRTQWIDHLNNDIWNATRQARDLMDQGYLPPATGSAELNPVGAWSISAQLQTELFGMITPGMPGQAVRRATYFAQVTNSGPAVEASAFYAAMYAAAYFETDVPTLIRLAQDELPYDAKIARIAERVFTWYERHPDDWRRTREMIRLTYDNDPEWWASRVNFASTIMALLYGDGDFMKTLTIACLAGWDADNNATTAAGLLGIILGFENLPEAVRTSTDIYFNQDVTGDLPQYTTVTEIARRTQAIAELVIVDAGGRVDQGEYWIPRDQ